jgi:malate dehydrogenase (oxaloacetate-decarboxylating)
VIGRRGYGFLTPVSQFLGLDRQGGEGYDQLRVRALIKEAWGGRRWRSPADPESSTMTTDNLDPVVGPEGAMPPVAGARTSSIPSLHPSASYSITMRVRQQQRPGAFARVAGAIGETGAILGAIDLVRAEGGEVVRDVTIACVDAAHGEAVVEAVGSLDGLVVERVSDRTFLMHLGGKIEVNATIPVKTRDDLSMAYTPGVARVSMAIHENVEKAWSLTIKGNAVAVISDGTAVLGLGDIGPEAAMPVMEGKALLFKEFAGVDAFPLCLATKDTDRIVEFVKAVAPTFGAINLEDISAPRCFEIERRLRAELDIPVFHDDQHGTAIVVLAALMNALRVVEKRAAEVKVVVVGAGAAGVACTEIMLAHGVRNIVVCDIDGVLHPDRPGLDPARMALAARTNPTGERGMANDVLAGADILIGVSGPGAVSEAAVRRMAARPVVFAMANPEPEVRVEAVGDDVAIMATGRSDYPNQINNVLAFPGVFRGALDVRARTINEQMKLAAARAIAAVVGDDELHAEYIIPSVFNRAVVKAVALAVARAAEASGVARRPTVTAAEAT